MLNVLFVRPDGDRSSGDGPGEPYFYRGAQPRVLYRLRLGEASLLTAEPQAVSRLRERCRDVVVETIEVDRCAAAT